jgi:hypothetical protein
MRPQAETSVSTEVLANELPDPLTGKSEGSWEAAPSRRFPQPAGIRWADAWRSAVLAGFFLTVAMAVPNPMPLAWFFVATVVTGGLSAVLYLRRSRLPLSLVRGARVGMLGGLAGWVAWITVSLLMIVMGGAQLIASLREALQKVVANSDPKAQEILAAPGVMAGVVAISVLFGLVVVLLCSALGGMIAAKLFGKGPGGNRE